MKQTIRIIIFFILICLTTVWESMSAGRQAAPCCSIAIPSLCLYAQEPARPAQVPSPETDHHADTSNVLYQVMGVILIIWLGLAIFLYRIDRRVAMLEKNIPETRGKKSE